LFEGFALSGKGFVSAKITRDTKSQETAKSQETEIIKIFLLLEFTW
jgi:hypothetical protein